MLNIFRRSRDPKFDIAAIGDHWLAWPLTHDGVSGTLHVRQLPFDLPRQEFPFVALAWMDGAETRGTDSAVFRSLKGVLEKRGSGLIVLVHETPGRVYWYAYAASAKILDEAFASLDNEALHWGINEDRGWPEYDNAKGLVGA
ncbi:hypothetical protein [Luteimonas lutimaris]|uniref:DUF695 domain-containing protein n=1 Tax=Luteimonas lutimaris TaxID=698645 RepID=A0ABP7MLP1_9GAMM